MSSRFRYTAEPSHIIEGKFVDQRKLMSLLRNVYGTSNEGENNFRVEVIYILLSNVQFPSDVHDRSTAKTEPLQNLPL
jgi:hypothetical protein